jgi:hypothetical protein
MTETPLATTVEDLHASFARGTTRPLAWRQRQLLPQPPLLLRKRRARQRPQLEHQDLVE